jgi:large subunit ribosomal protein L6
MSRIGKLPVKLPTGVVVEIHGHTVKVTGPKGELKDTFLNKVSITEEESQIIVSRKSDEDKAIHGLTRALIYNMVEGVSNGYTKQLEMVGIGYRAVVEGEDLVLMVGYSHPVRITAPSGIKFALADGKIQVSGIDKQLVGQTAAEIRAVRKPEPYKGKGIRYVGEVVRRKAGKSAKAGGK